MLSYRHGFHAGNHADVLKHMTVCLIMRSLLKKDKPFTVVDTHAGSGLYDLNSGFARKNNEYNTGWELIKDNERLQKLVPEFYEVVAKAQEEVDANKGHMYPGSPYFEYALSRSSDSIFLNDTHPSEFERLLQIFKRKRNVRVELRQCLDTINALLPPIKRRGLILIDPPYEKEQEYRQTVEAVKKGLGRFEQGIYAVWYPVLARMNDHSKNLVHAMRRLNRPLLQVELCVSEQKEDFGMCGSGMLIVNYPFKLYDALEGVVDELYNVLADADTGSAKLEILVEKQ